MKTFITPQGTHSLLQEIERLQTEFPDKRFVWEVRPYKKPRSLGLNNYAWGFVVTPLAEYVGETPARQWEIMCGEYFGWVEKEFRGHKYRAPRRTTTTNENGERDVLNWEQMSNFVHFCKSICAELGVPIPDNEAAA